MDLLKLIIFVIIGFVLLLKGADFLVNGASSLARRFKISELAIGFTIVAMGTSAPEFIVNLFSGLEGHSEIVFGNIIGSNIFNTYLILGVAGLIYPLSVQSDTVRFEIPFAVLITLLLFVLVNDQFLGKPRADELSFVDGLILVSLFFAFLIYIYTNIKQGSDIIHETELLPVPRTLLFITIGMAGLLYGGKLVVDNSISLAEHFGVSQKLIGLTIVAAGTSLPELATSAVAAMKKKSDIAIGNILGSNIFNILFVLGVNAMIRPIGYNTSFNLDLSFLFIGAILLFVFMFTFKSKKLDRQEAFLFLLMFLGYMTYVFIRS